MLLPRFPDPATLAYQPRVCRLAGNARGELVERARLLKSKIPRGLPRDYEALIKTCHDELDDIIARLRDLQLLLVHPLGVFSFPWKKLRAISVTACS